MTEAPILEHDAAIKALCDCCQTVTLLSIREVVEGYFKLRGMAWDGPDYELAILRAQMVDLQEANIHLTQQLKGKSHATHDA